MGVAIPEDMVDNYKVRVTGPGDPTFGDLNLHATIWGNSTMDDDDFCNNNTRVVVLLSHVVISIV